MIVAALLRHGPMPAHAFSLSWLTLSGFTPATFATGALTAVFFFWGWDVTLNLNEETKDATQTPGLGAVLSMIIVLLLFVGFACATLLVLSSLLPTVNQIMKVSVNAIGFQAAFYYGLASFACAWNTRRTALKSPGALVGLVPWRGASCSGSSWLRYCSAQLMKSMSSSPSITAACYPERDQP